MFEKIKKQKNVGVQAKYHMVSEIGNGVYVWNGKLYQSDIVRACIKPKTKAIGKLVAKHIRETLDDGKRKIETNPWPYIRFLLEEPNELMTGQMMQEKIVNQLALSNNAFILIIRDSNGIPCSLYPIPCTSVEAKFIDNVLYIKFYFVNGKSNVFPYSEIIHLRDDYFQNDIFGDNPGEALSKLMTVVGTIDQGIINAIKNSGTIRWLLKFVQSIRPEDLKKQAEDFANNYLSISSNSLGVAAVDAKAEAKQIQPTDYVPNAMQTSNTIKRIYDFFNTNEKIVNSTYGENEWISYYESSVEPLAIQMSNEFTRKLFTRKERAYGNKIIFETNNLTFASMSTKLNLTNLVDRAIMTPNEVREILGYAPIDGGDKALLRKDTGVVKGDNRNVGED